MAGDATPLTPGTIAQDDSSAGLRRHRGRPPAMPRAKRREQLLMLAGRIVDAGGSSALTMERLVEEAGVGKALVYSHFQNRSELVLTLLAEKWEHVDSELDRAMDGDASFEEMFVASTRVIWDTFATRGRGLAQLMIELGHDPVIEEAQEARNAQNDRRWAGLIEREFDLSPEHAYAAAVNLRGAQLASVWYWVTHDVPRERVWNTFATMIIAGLNALRENPESIASSDRD